MNKNLEINLNLCNKYIYCPNNLFCNETSTGRVLINIILKMHLRKL